MLGCISSLSSIGFSVHIIVTDNHTSNVSAFNILRKMHNSDNPLYFKHQQNTNKTFDNVHIVKNIKNNLLNAKKFVFPTFSFKIGELVSIVSQNGYISWDDLKAIYESDAKLADNLRKAPKLTFKALYPYNNKQNIGLALNIFEESTIAAAVTFPIEKMLKFSTAC